VAIVLVTPLARQDLSDIWDYLAENSVERADKLLALIHKKCLALAEFPEMGRARHELLVNLHSFAVRNYVIFYQPISDGIEVLRVLHGARDIPHVFDEMIDELKNDSEQGDGSG